MDSHEIGIISSGFKVFTVVQIRKNGMRFCFLRGDLRILSKNIHRLIYCSEVLFCRSSGHLRKGFFLNFGLMLFYLFSEQLFLNIIVALLIRDDPRERSKLPHQPFLHRDSCKVPRSYYYCSFYIPVAFFLVRRVWQIFI